MTTDAPPRLAIEGGNPVRATPFPARPPAPETGEEYPTRAPEGEASPIRAFESAFGATLDVPASFVTALGAYRAALETAFAAAGITRDSAHGAPGGAPGEVVVPALLGEPFAFAARELGLVAVPAEVEADAVTLSPRGLAQALSSRTVAVCVTDAFGHPPRWATCARWRGRRACRSSRTPRPRSARRGTASPRAASATSRCSSSAPST